MTLSPKDPRLDEPLKNFSLTDAVNMAKAMVHPDLAVFCTPVTIKETWEHPKRREYPIRICKNYFETAARADKRKQNMHDWTGFYLGSRDIITAKTDWDPRRVNGHRATLFRTDTGQLEEATIWGHGPGDEGSKKPLLFWHDLTMKVEENEFTRQSGEKDIGYTVSYLEKEESVAPQIVLDQLAKIAMPMGAIDEGFLYKQVILVGKLGSFKTVEDWEETGEVVPVVDADGNAVIDPKTGKAQMRAERMPTAEGQPLIQARLDDASKFLYTFQANLAPLEEGDTDTINRFRFRFLNKKLGNHLTILPAMEKPFHDAMDMGIGTATDGLEHLSSTFAGTEVIVVGTVTRFSYDAERDLNWIDVESTMMVPLDMSSGVEQVVTTPAPVPTPQPAPSVDAEPEEIKIVEPTPMPEIPAEPVAAPAPAPAPVAEPVAEPAAEPAGLPTVDQLKTIVLEGRELYGPSLTMAELESLQILPKSILDASGKVKSDNKKLVEHCINLVAKEIGDSPVGAAGHTSPPAAEVAVERQPGAAQPQIEPLKCNKCGKVLQPDEVYSHHQECEGKKE